MKSRSRKRTWRFRLNEGTVLEVSAPNGATEKQVRRRGRVSLVLGTMLAALLVSAAALGDAVFPDNDLATNGNQSVLNLPTSGTLAPGATVNTSAQLVVRWQGGTHLVTGDQVKLVVDTTATDLPAGYTVSPVTVTIPSGWDANGDEVAGTSNISFTAPASDTTYTVTWKIDTSAGSPTAACATASPKCVTGTPFYTVNVDVTAVSDAAPSVSSTSPTNGATGVARDANISITFSEAVNVSGSWFGISCGTSGSHTAAVTGGPTTFTLNPDSDFAKGEVCTVTVYAANVTDQDTTDPPDNMAANYSFSFTVVQNVPPTAEANGPYSGSEGSAISLSSSGSSDSDGTIASYAWSYSIDSADAGASCSFSSSSAANPTITCTDDGSYTVKLKVTDNDGAESVEDTAALELNNVAPDIGTVTPADGSVFAVNTSIALSVPFSDAGANDQHFCSIDWGDSTTTRLPLSGYFDKGTTSCGSPTHSYTAANLYTVTITVTDDDTPGTDSTTIMLVVYDPTAGFVTGGGWIDSPAGAYVPDPSLSGKATFGFVSKYKKGANVPDGNTEFQFHAAGFNFKSTAYQWLVVSGKNKAQYKGSGTVNGSLAPNGEAYTFLVTLYDGGNSGDRFRIKVWYTDSGVDVPVYDSGMTAASGLDDGLTAISGGSIMIHTGK